MAYISKIVSNDGEALDIAPPPDLTEAEKTEYRSRIGASSAESTGAPVRLEVTIATNKWASGSASLTASDYPLLSNVAPGSLVQFFAADDSSETVGANNIRINAQGTGSVGFVCDTTPSVPVSGELVIFN